MSLILSGTDGLSDVDGSAATPAIRGTDANTGIFFPSADTISFAEGGAEVARFDSSGNFGLGVTPSAFGGGYKAFEVNAGSISATTGAGNLIVSNNSYFNGTNFIYKATGVASDHVQTGGQHWFRTAPSGTAGNAISFTQAMTLNASGQLMVGSTSSFGVVNGEISVKAASGGAGVALWDAGVSSKFQLIAGAGGVNAFGLYDISASAYRWTVDSSGNLGIGTTSPINNGGYGGFSLNGTSGALLSMMTNGTESSRIASIGDLTSVQCKASTGYITFVQGVSGGTERARIDSSGNLLVAKTALSTTTVGVELRPGGRVVSTLASSTSGDSTYEVYSTGAGAYRFYVDMSGTIRATSITITAISDERLKENVRDIDTGLNSIMALKPRRFDWKEGKGQDKKNVAGFIAQEFETVFPECVSTSRAGADGIEYKNINHETLIPTLVKSIQEQQALITQLTARITALESA